MPEIYGITILLATQHVISVSIYIFFGEYEWKSICYLTMVSVSFVELVCFIHQEICCFLKEKKKTLVFYSGVSSRA